MVLLTVKHFDKLLAENEEIDLKSFTVVGKTNKTKIGIIPASSKCTYVFAKLGLCSGGSCKVMTYI